MNNIIKLFTFVLLSVSLFLATGCSTYKMEIQQGNAISNAAVQQLKKGMSKPEVSALLGSPLMQDNFRSNRWDYLYYTGHGEAPSNIQNLTLKFQNGQLVQVTK